MENQLQSQHHGLPLHPTAIPLQGVGSAQRRIPVSAPQTVADSPLANTTSSSKRVSAGVGPSQPKRAQKDRGPNWLPQEVLVLIQANRDQYMRELDTVDARDLMTPETSKWTGIFKVVMSAGLSPCMRDGPACKVKWNQILQDYKRIVDYLGRSGQNVPDFWELSSVQKKAEGLPGHYPHEFFLSLHDWFSSRPQIQPPHVRDLLSPADSNFVSTKQQTTQGSDEGNSDSEGDDPTHLPEQGVRMSMQSNSPGVSANPSGSNRGRPSILRSDSDTRVPAAFTPVAPSVTPVIISSSDTTAGFKNRPGNTAVRRKNLSGHTVIADATKATGAIMASQMKDIADASLQVERSKIEMQLKLFSEQMAYQRERDRRLHETAMSAHENARLAIAKQNEMVNCLTQLTAVLGRGLTQTSPRNLHNPEEPAQTTDPATMQVNTAEDAETIRSASPAH